MRPLDHQGAAPSGHDGHLLGLFHTFLGGGTARPGSGGRTGIRCGAIPAGRGRRAAAVHLGGGSGGDRGPFSGNSRGGRTRCASGVILLGAIVEHMVICADRAATTARGPVGIRSGEGDERRTACDGHYQGGRCKEQPSLPDGQRRVRGNARHARLVPLLRGRCALGRRPGRRSGRPRPTVVLRPVRDSGPCERGSCGREFGRVPVP